MTTYSKLKSSSGYLQKCKNMHHTKIVMTKYWKQLKCSLTGEWVTGTMVKKEHTQVTTSQQRKR